MFIGRTCLRFGLGGGGTDLYSYASTHGGFLCSITIDLHATVIAERPLFDPRIRVKVHDTIELVDELTMLKNEEVRAALALTGITSNVELVYMGEITGGTGLGTSGAYLVNLVNILNYFRGIRLTPVELAEAAAHIEIDVLGHNCGRHDHYLAALGGLVILNISKDGSVQADRVGISPDILKKLRDHLLLLYTHRQHVSGKILGVQQDSMKRGDQRTFDCYHRIKEIGYEVVKALREGDVVRVCKLFDQHWLVKRELPGGVSDQYFDFLYGEALKNGALGGKVLGAGGGGCILIGCEPARRVQVKNALCQYGLEEVPFNFDFRGVDLDCSKAKPHELVPFSGTPRRMVHFDSDLVS